MKPGRPTLSLAALCSVAWFHALVQERRKLIPQGWTKFYEFTSADLRVGLILISLLYNDSIRLQMLNSN